MGLLKFADKNDVKRYTHPDDPESWIELRNTLTKGEVNSLFNNMPDSLVKQAMVSDEDEESDIEGTLLVFRQAPEMSKALFVAYCKAWSLDAPCTLESYLELDPEASTWVDSTIMEHQTQDAQMTSAEGKPRSRSRRGSRKATAETTS